MGFFDKFKKNNNIEHSNNELKKENEIKYSRMPNGNIQVEFIDDSYEEGKFYNTTRLVFDKHPIFLANHPVYNCAVSWYNDNDEVFLNEKTGEYENFDANSYRGVLTELDLDLLFNDKKYCETLMKELLKKTRVEKYLEDGLKDVPEIPCGKYVGGIRKINDQYRKFFSQDIGLASHESDLMKGRRKELKEKISREKEEKIAEKREQILALQKEIDEMEK